MRNMESNNSQSVFYITSLRVILFILAGLLLFAWPSFKAKNLSDVSIWWPLYSIVVNIITIGILVYLAKKEGKNYWSLLNLNFDKKQNQKDILIAVPIMLVLGIGGLLSISYLVYGYMPLTNTHPLPIWAAITVVILLPVTFVLSEIPFYLGYCAPRLKEIGKSELFSIAYPLFFYALQHSFIPLLFDFKHILARFLMFIPLLFMMGIWYNRKKNLIPLMAGHGLLDVFIGIQLLMVSIYPSIYEMMGS